MAASASTPGCLLYFFLAALTAFGYLPMGRHGADFSKDSKKIVYKYAETEVRIRDLESGEVSPALYTVPEDWILNAVYWNQADGQIYAVAHNDPACPDEAPNAQWTVRLVRVNPLGGAATVTERTYYCLMTNKAFAFDPDAENQPLAAAYQNLDKAVSFKPVGWNNGKLYFMEPEEFTSDKPAIKSMDLATGKEHTEFALPGGAYSYLLSPDADYLVSLSLIKSADSERIVMELLQLATNKMALKETIAERRCNAGDCMDLNVGLWVLSGAESAAAFDEAAGKFFYLKLDAAAKQTGLYALDLASGKSTLLHSSFDISFFMPVPNRKALLLTAADSRAFDLFETAQDGPDELFNPRIREVIKTRLVSYEGKTLREYDVPPVLSAYLNGVRPDAALSPDGNLAAVTMVNLFDQKLPEGERFPKPTTIPALLNLEKGTLEFLITEPVDNALAGIYLSRLGDPAAAKPYLQALPRELWGKSELTRSAAFALLALQRHAGDKAADATRNALLQAAPTGTDPHMFLAQGYFLALTGSDPLASHLAYQTLHIDNLPALDASVPDADVKFLISELEAAPESWQASFLLGSLAAHAQRWADAATLLERAAAISREHADEDNPPLSMDFLLGEVYVKAGAPDKALALFENCDASLDDIALAKAPVLEQLGRFEEAAETYSFYVGSLKSQLEDLPARCENDGLTPADCQARAKDLKDQIAKYKALREAMRAKAGQ